VSEVPTKQNGRRFLGVARSSLIFAFQYNSNLDQAAAPL
jgi:hypothetical protein